MVECRQGSGNYLAANMSDTISKCIEMMLLLKQTSKAEVIAFRRQLDLIICREIITKDTVQNREGAFRDILAIEWSGSLENEK